MAVFSFMGSNMQVILSGASYFSSIMMAKLSNQSKDSFAERACFSISSRRSTKSPENGHFEFLICSRIKFNWLSRLERWTCAFMGSIIRD